jgi:hypothetical protein
MLKDPLAGIAWGDPPSRVSRKPSASMSTPVVTTLKSSVPVVGGAVESPPHAKSTAIKSSNAIARLERRVMVGGWEYKCRTICFVFWRAAICGQFLKSTDIFSGLADGVGQGCGGENDLYRSAGGE